MTKLFILGAVPFFLTACTNDVQKEFTDRDSRKGRISVPLTAMSSSGLQYLVQIPYLSLENGLSVTEFSLLNQNELDVAIAIGGYSLYTEGAELYRLEDDGRSTFVETEMTSPNPQFIEIIENETTVTQISFRVLATDEEVVTTGRLSFDFYIDDSPDSDGDGLSDEQEIEYGTDPEKSDTDFDGLSDADEIFEFATDPISLDSDEDLLSDGEEVMERGTDPHNQDTDGDGITDMIEVLFDLDPTVPSDAEFIFNRAWTRTTTVGAQPGTCNSPGPVYAGACHGPVIMNANKACVAANCGIQTKMTYMGWGDPTDPNMFKCTVTCV